MQDDIAALQLRAARAILGYSVAFVAEVTGVGSATLKRYEAAEGVPKARKGHLLTIKKFYEKAGVEFIGGADEGPGLRFRSPNEAPLRDKPD